MRPILGFLSLVMSVTKLVPVKVNALTFISASAKLWAMYTSQGSARLIGPKQSSANPAGEVKSDWRVTYK